MDQTTVIFQGDSITDCGRENSGGAGLDTKGLGPGYAGMIAARIMCDHPEKEWNFINRGISGNRIVDLYARWKRDVLNLRPDILSILIGINDTWHERSGGNGVEVPRYDRIYRELISWTQTTLPEIKIVLLEPFLLPHPNCGGKEEWMPEVRERQAVVRRIAEENRLLFIPLQSIFDAASRRAPQPYWSADGVHPSLAGQQLIADA